MRLFFGEVRNNANAATGDLSCKVREVNAQSIDENDGGNDYHYASTVYPTTTASLDGVGQMPGLAVGSKVLCAEVDGCIFILGGTPRAGSKK